MCIKKITLFVTTVLMAFAACGIGNHKLFKIKQQPGSNMEPKSI